MVKFNAKTPKEDNKSLDQTQTNSHTKNMKNDIQKLSEPIFTNPPLIPKELQANEMDHQPSNSNNLGKNEKEIIPLKPKAIYARVINNKTNYGKKQENSSSIKIPKNLNMKKFKDDSLAELFHFHLSKYYRNNSGQNPKVLYGTTFKDEDTDGNFGSIYSYFGQKTKENEQKNICELSKFTKKGEEVIINFGESLNKYYNKLCKEYFYLSENNKVNNEIRKKIIECQSIIKRQNIFEYISYKKYIEEFNKKCDAYYIYHSINSLINNRAFYEIAKKIALKMNDSKTMNLVNLKKIKENVLYYYIYKKITKKQKKKKFIRIGHKYYQIIFN